MDEMDVAATRPQAIRLQGYIHKWFPEEKYGFITVKGATEDDGRQKQWHFHVKSLKAKTNWRQLAVGIAVAFTPVSCPIEGKRDKATAIEVMG
jgi:hypothetical protein